MTQVGNFGTRSKKLKLLLGSLKVTRSQIFQKKDEMMISMKISQVIPENKALGISFS